MNCSWKHLASLALGTSTVCLLSLAIGRSEEAPQSQAQNATTATFEVVPRNLPTPEQIEAWKKQFPYESLADRLAYEKPHRERPAPTLSDEAAETLRAREQNSVWAGMGNARGKSLRLLHTDKLVEFMSKPGMGVSRMEMPPGPGYLRTPELPELVADEVKPLSGEYLAEQAVSLPTANVQSGANPWRLPTREKVAAVNQFTQQFFASEFDFGDVESVDRVAGFLGHRFRSKEWLPHVLAETEEPPKPEEPQWKIARLELVSLLKSETPGVYMSEHLPAMDELKDAKTRPLSEFEQAGLEKLVAGEEVFVESHGNTIEMVGAIRAVEQCRQCHDVPRGTLLGAFSYDLQRDPPVKPEVLPETR